jgi:hypothetical protein
MRQRVFTTSDVFDVDIELAHFGAEPIEKAKVVARIVGAKPELQGDWDIASIPIGKNIRVGKISVDGSKFSAPVEYKLVVTVGPSKFFSPVDRKIIPSPDAIRGKTYFENDWTFWVYPPSNVDVQVQPGKSVDHVAHHAAVDALPRDCPPVRSDVFITNSIDEAVARLNAGGRVIFSPRNIDLDWMSPPLDAVPVFWNRQMGPGWGRMLGLFIDRKQEETKSHMLDRFPTSSYFDWQWAQIIPGVRAINLERLPPDLSPVVWAIDDWNRNYKLGVLFECVVGDGRLLVSAIDVTRTNVSNPVLRQLRRSLVDYANSDCFQPNVSVSRAELRSLFFDTRIMTKLKARAEVGGAAAGQVIDGDPNTFILVGDQRASFREQVDIVISFPKPVAMSGLVLMPRQNHREHEGEIRDLAVQVSEDGTIWSDVARTTLVSSFEPKRIIFSNPVTSPNVRLVSLGGFGTDKTTSLAEVAVIYAGPKLNDRGEPIEYQRNRSATPDIDEGPDRPKPSPSPAAKPKPTRPR